MSGLACCWPPSVDGGGGALEIGFTPVVGGLPGEVLKVGPGGLLDQAVLPVAPVAIGSPVAGGTSKSVLFVDAASKLAQKNASFKYDPALNRLSVDSVVGLLELLANGDFVKATGTPNGTGTGPSAYFSLHTFDINPALEPPDPGLTIGMNLRAGDSLVDAAFGGIGLSMEGFYDNGTTKIQELRLVFVPKASALHPSVRCVSIGGNQENGATTLGLSADSIAWFDGLGAQQGTLGPGVHVTDGSYRSSTYGSVLLEQLNSLGTVHANLFVLANGFVDGQPDRLAIGVGGAVSRTQIYKGLDVYSFDYTVAPALKLATSTGPVAPLNFTVDVDAIDPNGVVSRNPGSMFVRVLGGGSTWYINRSATTPGTAWSIVTAVP